MVEHSWNYCGFCRLPIVLCGTCGTSTCTPMNGEIKLPDGSTTKCTDCNEAHDRWQKGTDMPEKYVEWMRMYAHLDARKRPQKID